MWYHSFPHPNFYSTHAIYFCSSPAYSSFCTKIHLPTPENSLQQKIQTDPIGIKSPSAILSDPSAESPPHYLISSTLDVDCCRRGERIIHVISFAQNPITQCHAVVGAAINIFFTGFWLIITLKYNFTISISLRNEMWISLAASKIFGSYYEPYDTRKKTSDRERWKARERRRWRRKPYI